MPTVPSMSGTSRRAPVSPRSVQIKLIGMPSAFQVPAKCPKVLAGNSTKPRTNTEGKTLAVARKLVAYLVAIDRSQRDFLVVEKENCAAA